MKIQQLSLFLENKPGRLLEACEAMSKAGVNVETTSLVEAGDFGILRVLVKDPQKAFDALKSRFSVKTSDVLAVQTPDKPGELAKLLKLFAKTPNLNVEYMYGFTSKASGVAALVLCFNDVDRALSILKEANVDLVQPDNLFA